jgi:pimeloyl-ACP methyl ester carboxylesterase
VALVGDRFTVVAPDLGGFGRSDKPEVAYDRDFHLDNLDAAVAAVVGDASPVVVVGHSLGGVLAGLWAARNLPRIAGLALVATPYPAADLCMPASYQRTYDGDQRRGRQRVYAAMRSAWPVITFPVRSRVFPRRVIVDYMRNTPQSYWSTARNILWNPATEPELEPLARFAGPALIVAARDDRNVPLDNAARWGERLPFARQQITTGGHQLLLRTHFRDLALWLGSLVSEGR